MIKQSTLLKLQKELVKTNEIWNKTKERRKTHPMKLVVLMSTYNGEHYLREQIDSILNQKLNIEIDLIVRDDGSADSTRKILKEYADSGKLKLIEGNNVGAAKSFIYLLRDHPGYDYYAFSDQDDVWNENKLQNGVDAIKDIKGPALYCSNGELVDAELNNIGRNIHRALPTYTLESILCLASCAQGCTSVFNKELAMIVQNNNIPEKFIMHDSMVTCLCALINGSIIYDEIPSLKYRIHGNNVIGLVTANQSKLKVLKNRASEIFKKKKITAYDQARSLLNTYNGYIPQKNKDICELLIESEKSLPARLKLVCNKNLKDDTLNKTVTKKLEILFGNA